MSSLRSLSSAEWRATSTTKQWDRGQACLLRAKRLSLYCAIVSGTSDGSRNARPKWGPPPPGRYPRVARSAAAVNPEFMGKLAKTL